jgi:uncharacterized protein with GYD domain
MTKYKIMAEYTDQEGKNFKYRKIGVADTMEEALEIGKAIQPNMIITGNFRIVGVCLDTLDEETTYEGLSDTATEQKIRMYEEDIKFYEKEIAEVSKRKPTKSQAELLDTYTRYLTRAKRKIEELKNGTYHD